MCLVTYPKLSAWQVSWCKLEVELASPKSIMRSTAEGQPQDVPPLVVAALNLKTRFNAQVHDCAHYYHLFYSALFTWCPVLDVRPLAVAARNLVSVPRFVKMFIISNCFVLFA